MMLTHEIFFFSSESQAKDQLTPAKLREHFEKYKQVVIENEMFNASMLDVPKELPGENLILAIQEKVTSGKLVKFASEVSAVTHLFKHENGDLSGPMSQTKNYVKIANEIICDPSAAGKVSWTQEGSSRLIEFSVPGQGKVILLETSEGKVLLSTYIEGSRVRTAAGG